MNVAQTIDTLRADGDFCRNLTKWHSIPPRVRAHFASPKETFSQEQANNSRSTIGMTVEKIGTCTFDGAPGFGAHLNSNAPTSPRYQNAKATS